MGMDENPSVHGGVAANTTAWHPSGSRCAPHTLTGDHGWAVSPTGSGARRPRRPDPRLVVRSLYVRFKDCICADVADWVCKKQPLVVELEGGITGSSNKTHKNTEAD